MCLLALNLLCTFRPRIHFSKLIEQLRAKWEQIVPEIPFEFSFPEDMDETGYRAEKRQATLIMLFTVLAIWVFISFLPRGFPGIHGKTGYFPDPVA